MVENEKIERIRQFLLEKGAWDVGFTKTDDDVGGFNNAISIVIKLSDSVISEIDESPTFTYFTHYRGVNAFIDSLILQTGMFIEKMGNNYIPIPASQSINSKGNNYEGRYSHKKVARLSGLGSIGKNALFIHKDFGPCVRLGTIFCDIEMPAPSPIDDICVGCDKCVKACPAMAITGESFDETRDRSHIFDAKSCSDYMKNNFMHIGRGAVCGICIKTCNDVFKARKRNV
ncbi:MAG: epoxyqueuosine reductase [Clostridia bacterium]|nr:epoxyqueuosine reductase [Clostridia bacterium]